MKLLRRGVLLTTKQTSKIWCALGFTNKVDAYDVEQWQAAPYKITLRSPLEIECDWSELHAVDRCWRVRSISTNACKMGGSIHLQFSYRWWKKARCLLGNTTTLKELAKILFILLILCTVTKPTTNSKNIKNVEWNVGLFILMTYQDAILTTMTFFVKNLH